MDFSHLKMEGLSKGCMIPAETLERVVGLPREHKNFAFRCLRVMAAIRVYFAREHSLRVRPAMRGDNLHILDDREMSDAAHYGFEAHLRGLHRDHDDMRAVQVRTFNAEEQKRHDRRCLNQALLLQMLQRGQARTKEGSRKGQVSA